MTLAYGRSAALGRVLGLLWLSQFAAWMRSAAQERVRGKRAPGMGRADRQETVLPGLQDTLTLTDKPLVPDWTQAFWRG